MALNFGSFFEKLLGADLRAVANKTSKTMGDFATSFSNASDDLKDEINTTAANLKSLTDATKKYKDSIADLKVISDDITKSDEERITAAIELERQQGLLTQAEEQHAIATHKLTQNTRGLTKSSEELKKKMQTLSSLTFENVKMNAAKMYEEFNKTGKTTSAISGQILTSFEDIEKEKFGQNISSGFNVLGGSFDDIGKGIGGLTDGLGSQLGGAIGELMPALGPLASLIGEGLVKAVGKAFEQISKLNEMIVGLTRSTGGMVKASMLGTDQFGNVKGTMHSLQTEVLGANVSMEQFGEAINDLMTNGMGPIAGVAKIGAGDLKKYGLEAAQFSKLYGADISGSVRNMFMDFRKPIGEITDSIDNAAMKIDAAGLSVKEFVKNLQDVTDMSGKLYFKDGIEGMEQLAETATRLGTSVSALTDGLQDLNSLTDLYTKQQKAAAMGMHNLGRNMAKIFALKQAGKSGEAANLQLASAAKDLSQFMDKQGKISQQGIATAQGMGMSADDVKNIERLTAGAKAAGVSMDKFMGPLKNLTKEEQKAVKLEKKKNQTLKERWDIATGTFMQSFIDPIANLLAPVLDSLMSAFEGIMSVLSVLGKVIMTIVTTVFKPIAGFFSGIFDTLGEVFGDLGDKLSNLWSKIEPVFSAIGTALSTVGYYIGKFLMVPLKIIGKVIGWVIDALSWLIDKIKPVFTFLGDAFSKVGDILTWFGKKLKSALSWIAAPFKAVGKGLSWMWGKVKSVFSPVISVFGALGSAIQTVIKWFDWFGSDKEAVVSDAEAVQAMTNQEIANNLSKPTPQTGQNLNPGASMQEGSKSNAPTTTVPLTSGQQATQGLTGGVKVVVNSKTDLIGSDIKVLTTSGAS